MRKLFILIASISSLISFGQGGGTSALKDAVAEDAPNLSEIFSTSKIICAVILLFASSRKYWS